MTLPAQMLFARIRLSKFDLPLREIHGKNVTFETSFSSLKIASIYTRIFERSDKGLAILYTYYAILECVVCVQIFGGVN